MNHILAFGMPPAPEWIFIGILALVLFGPKKLPELARGLGKALAELQKAKEDFHREITGVPPMPEIKSPEGLQGIPKSLSPVNEAPIAGGEASKDASQEAPETKI